jgi:formylglycine-generating enzyme required for sulfatase activity
VNFVEWHIAFAFCIWDGGRLPADSEWVYAAYRGDEQTKYAWGDTPAHGEMFAAIPAPTVPYAYGGTNDFWKWVAIPVGSHPASVGRFGHHDLMAGLWEHTRDARIGDPDDFIWLFDEETPPGNFTGFEHRARGGGWEDHSMPAYIHSDGGGGIGWSRVGFRCARDLR